MTFGFALAPEVGAAAWCVPDAVGLADELAPALCVPLAALWVPLPALPEPEPLDEPLDAAVGGWWVGADVPEVDADVQPATATEARMAKTPKRMTVSFALSTVPAMGTRTVI